MWGTIRMGLCLNGRVKLQPIILRQLEFWSSLTLLVEKMIYSLMKLVDTHTDLPPPRVNIPPPPDESLIDRQKGIISPLNPTLALRYRDRVVPLSPLKRNPGTVSRMVILDIIIVIANMDRLGGYQGDHPSYQYDLLEVRIGSNL